jgi:hypothetical protein
MVNSGVSRSTANELLESRFHAIKLVFLSIRASRHDVRLNIVRLLANSFVKKRERIIECTLTPQTPRCSQPRRRGIDHWYRRGRLTVGF